MKDLWATLARDGVSKSQREDEKREDCSKLRKSTSIVFVTFLLPFWTNEISNIEMKSNQ